MIITFGSIKVKARFVTLLCCISFMLVHISDPLMIHIHVIWFHFCYISILLLTVGKNLLYINFAYGRERILKDWYIHKQWQFFQLKVST